MKHGHGSLAGDYLDAAQQMEQLYEGVRLRDAAADVLAQLPAGPLVLLAASAPGAGLAAACAALRNEPTTWGRVTLTHDQAPPGQGQVVFVEPIPPETGWLSAMQRRHAGAIVVVPRRGEQTALAA